MSQGIPADAAQQPGGRQQRAIDWEIVYDEHAARIRRIIERRAGTAVADDLLQETFERALRGQNRFDLDRPMAPWLNTIAFHLTSDVRRQRLSSGEVLVDEEPDIEGPDIADEAYTATLRRLGIRLAFASLNQRHRRVLHLVAIEGMTNEEVAEFEHMSTEAVKSVLARARVNFRASYSAFVEKMGLMAGVAFGPLVMRLRARCQRYAELAGNHAGAITVAAVTTAVVGVATLPATKPESTRATETVSANAIPAAALHEATGREPAIEPRPAAPRLPATGATDPSRRHDSMDSSQPDTVGVFIEAGRKGNSATANLTADGHGDDRVWYNTTVRNCSASLSAHVLCTAIDVASEHGAG